MVQARGLPSVANFKNVGQNLVLAEEPCVLKRLPIRQVAQRAEAEMRQEFLGGYGGVGGAGLETARN